MSTAATAYRISGRRVMRSEWAKLWSLRSSWMMSGLGLAFLIVFGAIGAASWSPAATSGIGQASNPVELALGVMDLVMVIVGVFGVLFTAGEYTTGMIRSTMTAVPRRLPVLWSKIGLAGGVSLVIGTVGALISYSIGAVILHGTSIALPITASGVLRCLLGAAVCLALVSVMGAALGALLRSVAGGITMTVGVMLLLSALAGLLPATLRNDISPYLPGNAASSVYTLHQSAHTLSPAAGLAVLAGWAAAAMAAAAYRLVRADV